MKLWKLERKTAGYGEMSLLILVAESEQAARAWAVKYSRSQSYAAEWMFEDEATCEELTAEGHEPGDVLATGNEPS